MTARDERGPCVASRCAGRVVVRIRLAHRDVVAESFVALFFIAPLGHVAPLWSVELSPKWRRLARRSGRLRHSSELRRSAVDEVTGLTMREGNTGAQPGDETGGADQRKKEASVDPVVRDHAGSRDRCGVRSRVRSGAVGEARLPPAQAFLSGLTESSQENGLPATRGKPVSVLWRLLAAMPWRERRAPWCARRPELRCRAGTRPRSPGRNTPRSHR